MFHVPLWCNVINEQTVRWKNTAIVSFDIYFMPRIGINTSSMIYSETSFGISLSPSNAPLKFIILFKFLLLHYNVTVIIAL